MQWLHPTLVGFVMIAVSPLGCAKKTRLADISEPSMSVSIQRGMATVVVLPGDAAASIRGPCKLVAASARATLNGVVLPRRRGKSIGDDFMYDRDCVVEFGVTEDAVSKTGPGASIQISDESLTWKFEAPTALAPRSFAVVTPGNRIRRSDRVVLRWSPASDRFDSRMAGFELYGANSGRGTGAVVHDIQVRNDELSFAVSPHFDAVPSGPSMLEVVGTQGIRAASGACPVRECAVYISFSVPALPITLEE